MRRYMLENDPLVGKRKAMVEDQVRSRGIVDPWILAAMERVPRHRFLPPSLWREAYCDFPLHIGEGQTISQPFIVALMTEALELTVEEKVLEIGTGVGYQTAILAELAKSVFTIERIASLAHAAQEHLRAFEYKNIHGTVGDGTLGLPREAPFDRIIATGGLPSLPQSFQDQVVDGGIIVLPVGERCWCRIFILGVSSLGTGTHRLITTSCCYLPLSLGIASGVMPSSIRLGGETRELKTRPVRCIPFQ
jgi:protein-L-isoaspartate(D-aspartate) O-methyltransferase